MRKLLGFGLILFLLTGCGPELSKQDLGRVVFKMPSTGKQAETQQDSQEESASENGEKANPQENDSSKAEEPANAAAPSNAP